MQKLYFLFVSIQNISEGKTKTEKFSLAQKQSHSEVIPTQKYKKE